MSDPDYIHIRFARPKPRTIFIASAFVAGLLLAMAIPLASTTMKVPRGNCGTIFASSGSWTYSSHAQAAEKEAQKFVRAPADLDDYASFLVDNMMSDLAVGSAVHDQCKAQHRNRLIWISLAITAALVAGGVSFHFWRRQRSVT